MAKGPNFAIAPNKIPNVDYITAVESMCQKLKEEDAEELRAEHQLPSQKSAIGSNQTFPSKKVWESVQLKKGQGQGSSNSQ